MHRRSFLAAAAALTAAVPFLRRSQPSEAAQPSLPVAVPEPAAEPMPYFGFNQLTTTTVAPSWTAFADGNATIMYTGGSGSPARVPSTLIYGLSADKAFQAGNAQGYADAEAGLGTPSEDYFRSRGIPADA